MMDIHWLLCVLLYFNVAKPLPLQPDDTNMRNNNIDDSNPAAKCQDIYKKNKQAPSGYYDLLIDGHLTTVYCYFHTPQITTIRQLYSLDGTPQEFQIELPVPVGNGDPEGAMEMQYGPGDIPPGAGPHFTQAIIDEQEKMYYNKTETIQNLIDKNNRNERQRKLKQEKENLRTG